MEIEFGQEQDSEIEEEQDEREKTEMEKQLRYGTSPMDHLLFNYWMSFLARLNFVQKFLIEKMDDITFIPSENGNEKESAVKKSGRG